MTAKTQARLCQVIAFQAFALTATNLALADSVPTLPAQSGEGASFLKCDDFKTRFRDNIGKVGTFASLFSQSKPPFEEDYPRWPLRGNFDCTDRDQIRSVSVCVDIGEDEIAGPGPQRYFREVLHAFILALRPGATARLSPLWDQVLAQPDADGDRAVSAALDVGYSFDVYIRPIDTVTSYCAGTQKQ